ncbi:MAG TPA: chromate transporter [Clostridiaceae bacterium]|nr:chromate transporter [Clostridiaceae bacterium]
MKSKLLLSAISFLKIGTIGFGGGSSLIPVVEKEIVQNKKYISEKDYTEHVIVSNITPGALPVKLCAAAGMQIAGYIGMLTGALAVALPGSLGTVLILSFLSVLSGGFLNQVTYASFGISAFIIFILISYIRRVISDSAKAGFKKQAVVIMLVSAALTFGKEIREVLANITGINLPEFLKRPVLDIATVDLMLLVFFVIFYRRQVY